MWKAPSLFALCLLTAAQALLGLACTTSTGGGGSSQACIPGKTEICPCPGGLIGTQACAAHGKGYGACDCGESADVGAPDTRVALDEGPAPDTGTPATDTEAVCDANFQQACFQGDLYWFDSCGELGELAEECPADTQCANGACGQCESQFEQKCYQGALWWYDSCGKPQEQAEPCGAEEFCVIANCIKPTYEGVWQLTADPDTKLVGGLSIPYLLKMVQLTVSGDQVSGALINDPDASGTLSGTISGKKLSLTGSLSDGQQIAHTVEVTLTFQSPTTASGTVVEQLVQSGGAALGSPVWQVSAEKL